MRTTARFNAAPDRSRLPVTSRPARLAGFFMAGGGDGGDVVGMVSTIHTLAKPLSALGLRESGGDGGDDFKEKEFVDVLLL